jgi:uncharacterized membrane protein
VKVVRSTRIVIALGFVASLLFYSRLPGPSLTGPFLRIGPVSLAPRPLIAFVLPVAAWITYSILRQIWADDDSETYESISLVIVLFIDALHLLLLVGFSAAPGTHLWLARIAVMLFGLLLMVCGNLLPRTRPNLAFGIRTRRTLANRELWVHIHRVGGYVAVALGLVIVLAGAFLTKPAIPVLVNAAGLAAVVTLVVSYNRKRVSA